MMYLKKNCALVGEQQREHRRNNPQLMSNLSTTFLPVAEFIKTLMRRKLSLFRNKGSSRSKHTDDIEFIEVITKRSNLNLSIKFKRSRSIYSRDSSWESYEIKRIYHAKICLRIMQVPNLAWAMVVLMKVRHQMIVTLEQS